MTTPSPYIYPQPHVGASSLWTVTARDPQRSHRPASGQVLNTELLTKPRTHVRRTLGRARLSPALFGPARVRPNGHRSQRTGGRASSRRGQ